MKLSAPPPPPPEPPEPEPTPEPNKAEAASAPAADSLAPPTEPASNASPDNTAPAAGDTLAAPAAGPAPEKKPATWPTWFGGADLVLVVLVVALGFLVASFAARNSDLWLHLGSGRMLTSGQYSLGSDPMSYTGADRPWVNHSWLFDLVASLLYSTGGSGFVLVFLKACAVALAVGLLIAIRRPEYPLWPWATCAAVAVLAIVPRLALSPYVGSILFLAATLFVLFRVPSRPGSWRVPITIGVLFWLWASVDAWFILGPLAVGLLLVGELIQQWFFKRPEATDAPELLGPLPDIRTLALTLAVGVVACTLTPHHYRVWDIPFELAGSDQAARDPRLKLVLLTSPLDSVYTDQTDQGRALGWNLNGLAYAGLLVGGGVALGFGVGRLRVSHLVLWVGFALLSLASLYAVPFFAVVAVPLIAAQLNALSAGVRLGHRTERRTRLLLLGSGGGRVLCLLALVAACAAAWPGWLHPPTPNPANERRVAWAVEPDPALVRAATEIEGWRTSGALPEGARGLNVSIELANYVAYFAPHEKVFLNGRYNHHRPEMKDFVEARLALGLIRRDEPPSLREAGQILSRNDASYLVVYDSQRLRGASRASILLWMASDNWSPWYLDGRTTIYGWRPTPAAGSEAFDRLRLDPVALAFGPGQERLPAGQVAAVPPSRELLDEFVRAARPVAPGVDEALGWLDYKGVLQTRLNIQQGLALQMLWAIPAPQGSNPHEFTARFAANTGLVPGPGYRDGLRGPLLASPVLALRAARRAIAANPDHPDGYYALAQALSDQDLPIPNGERQLGIVTAYRQCLSRMPPPEEYRRGVFSASPTDVAVRLALLYLNPAQQGQARPQGLAIDVVPFPELAYVQEGPQGQPYVAPLVPLDVARQTILLALEYAKRESQVLGSEERDRSLKGLEEMRKYVEDMLRVANDEYTRLSRQQPKPAQRYDIARRNNLVGEAIQIVKGIKGEDIAKEFGLRTPEIVLRVAALEMALGRLEEAADDIDAIDSLYKQMAAEPTPNPNLPRWQALLRLLRYQQLLLAGNYAEAGSEMESILGKVVKNETLMPDLAKQNIDPKNYKDFDAVWPPLARLGVAWPLVPMLGADSVLGVPAAYAAAVLQLEHFERFAQARNLIQSRAQQESEFFFRRGLLSLLEGDIAAARLRFEQAAVREVPPGWGVQPVKSPLATEYLRLIDEAQKKAAAR